MTIFCELSQHDNNKVRNVALQCLNQISDSQYQVMEAYMQALFEISLKAMQNEDESVALQGIEFWTLICVNEAKLQHESKHYILGAREHLIPALLACMEKQEDGADPKEWCISQAGHVCMRHVVQTIKDDAIPLILPYIADNIASGEPKWQKRDTAVQAFGSTLYDGPDKEKMAVVVKEGLTTLLSQ